MSKRTLVFIFVASLALNIAFAASWAGYRFTHGFTNKPGVELPIEKSGGIWCPLHRSLNVNKKQWQELEPRLLEFRNQSQEICKQVNQKRSEMIDILSSENPDRQLIADKQKEILAVQQKMQQLVIEHLLFEKGILNIHQQKEFFELFRQQCSFGPADNTSRNHSFRRLLNNCDPPREDGE